jgi:hypothetical protein
MRNRKLAVVSRLALGACLSAGIAACGEKKPEVKDPVEVKPKGPDYSQFAPLEMADKNAELPRLIGANEIVPCFEKAEGLVPAEPDIVTKDLIEQHSAEIETAIRDWLVAGLGVTGVTSTLAQKWSVSLEEPVVLEVPPDKIRFAESPECLGKGWIPEGQHLATALFGGTRFAFESSIPLNSEIQQALLEALGMENIVVESEALFVYEVATDDDGNPLTDPEGKTLYTSPSGEYITEDQIPPPEKRTMQEWKIVSEQPIYFAFREIAEDEWRKEGYKEKCNTILIPDALKPQPPDCPEFQESGFSVSVIQGEEKPVSLTITTGDQHKGVMLDWGEPDRIQVNDRIILWLMPKKVEVGVELMINSLVLNPKPMPDSEQAGETAGYEEEPSTFEKNAAVEEEDPGGDEKKKKKKMGEMTDEDAIDAFLNE